MYILRKLLAKMVNINNYVLFLSSGMLIIISTILIVSVEKENFPTYFDGFWWVMTTVTTVGYGDYYPVTIAGRLIAVTLYILGIGLIGVVIGKVVDGFASFRKKRLEGDIVYKEKNHYIIIGWSQKASFAIKEIMDTYENAEVVIIDDLKEAPFLKDNIHYIKGNASQKDILVKANAASAKAVMIFADDRINDDQLIDGKTLLIASTVEALAPDVHTIVEVMEEAHIKNFKHVKVDEFIVSNETVSSLAVRSAFMNGVSNIYGQLLSRSHGDDLYLIPKRKDWKTYRDAFESLLHKGATLIADGNDLNINRRLDEPIPEKARLFAICDHVTYQKIIGNEGAE
ncbi:potassium channel family protein [Thalassobacillus devorans]|uniref:potassium channel family protein n=1 Tax=Thalassobacillus devorans TaxID=279813 RepID=UPI00049043A0|nr:ion channel [Thalassobacillus devorans]